VHGMHAAATSKVENLAQGLSCKLKFVHVSFSPVPSIGVPSLLNKTGESGATILATVLATILVAAMDAFFGCVGCCSACCSCF
jgi:hypothetical protein